MSKKIIISTILCLTLTACGSNSMEDKLASAFSKSGSSQMINENEKEKTYKTDKCEYKIKYEDKKAIGFTMDYESKDCKDAALEVLKDSDFLGEDNFKNLEKDLDKSQTTKHDIILNKYTINISDKNFKALKLSEPKSVKEVLERIKAQGLPIADITYYNEQNDPNEQLGRPNQYIEKANFNDNDYIKTSVDKYIKEFSKYGRDEKAIKGYEKLERETLDSTVELFASDKDLQNRYDYIKMLSDNTSSPISPNQYLYKNGLFLLRVSYDVTPENAKAYEKAFNNLFE